MSLRQVVPGEVGEPSSKEGQVWHVDNGVEGWECVRGGLGTGKIDFIILPEASPAHIGTLTTETHQGTHTHISKPTHTPQGLTNLERRLTFPDHGAL